MIGDKLNFERVAFPCAASKIKQDASERGVQLYYYDLKDLGCSDTTYVVSPGMVLEASPPNMWVIISEWLVVSLAVALAVYGLVRARTRLGHRRLCGDVAPAPKLSQRAQHWRRQLALCSLSKYRS